MDDVRTFNRAEITDVIAAGPDDGETFYRLLVSGKRSTKHLRVTAEQANCVAAILDGDPAALLAALSPRNRADVYTRLRESFDPTAPDPVTIIVDTLGAAGLVAALSPANRESVMDEINAAAHASADAAILDAVRKEVARLTNTTRTRRSDHPALRVVGVFFHADTWDNGIFIDTTGDLVYANGAVVSAELDLHNWNSEFADAFGHVGLSAGVVVDLRGDGSVSLDDYSHNQKDFIAALKAEASAA